VTKLLLIAAGGAGGALLRYAVSSLTYRYVDADFPWGTLIVNLSGCYMIGLLWGFSERTPFSANTNLLVFTGILGAYTTFSTFGIETFNLLRGGEIGPGLLNILGSNVLGLACVLLGFASARLLSGGVQSGA
jgi:fluoride exporter